MLWGCSTTAQEKKQRFEIEYNMGPNLIKIIKGAWKEGNCDALLLQRSVRFELWSEVLSQIQFIFQLSITYGFLTSASASGWGRQRTEALSPADKQHSGSADREMSWSENSSWKPETRGGRRLIRSAGRWRQPWCRETDSLKDSHQSGREWRSCDFKTKQ